MTLLSLKTSLEKVPGIGPKTFNKLTRSNLTTIQDLLEYYPKKHHIFHATSTLEAKEGDFVIIHGNIAKPYSKKSNRFSIQSATLKDSGGNITLRWFNQPYLTRSIKPNETYQVSGRIERFRGQKQILNPQLVKTNNQTESQLVPQYRQAGDLNSKWLKKTIKKLIPQLPKIHDPIKQKIREKYSLIDKKTALNQIHWPSDFDQLEKAIYRISFEEIFTLQKSALKQKKLKRKSSNPLTIDKEQLKQFISNLPFKLTASQLQSIQEIQNDLSKNTAMNRLLMGDVGTGKTIVAVAAAYIASKNNKKTLVMAPTQVLTEQLYDNFTKFLKDYNIKVEIITGKKKPQSEYDILIGTHALIMQGEEITEGVGLVIIDEQHKFGVKQREKLTSSQIAPHYLNMTATPIPRSLALTLISNTDVSLLEDKPKNQQEIKTYLVPEHKRDNSYSWIKKLIDENNYKVFIVTPLIQDSEYENLTHIKSAESLHKEITAEFDKYKIDLLHGSLKEDEKTNILHNFKNGITNILISTTIIEVGIDIPEANIIIIESAERFGLSQLHQLRGRVGRTDKQGHCLLFVTSQTPKSIKRLNYFTKHNNGAKLAELDMELRGPGELWGIVQHGYLNLKMANIFDKDLVQSAYQAAKESLDLSQHPD